MEKTLFGDKLIETYLEVFNSYSIANELYGRISLHVLLGQALCKHVCYQMGSRRIDPRVHLLLIKPQGTGKGAGYGFIDKMAKSIGLDFQSLTESTDAGLVGTLEKDGNETVVVDGLLKTADIIGMEEASVLFDYTNDFSKKNMTYMQITMNPLEGSSCKISKKLGTELIEIEPHASFVLLTYPPDKLVDKLLKTGFIDRVIPVFEDVTLEERLMIIEKMSEAISTGIDKKDEIDKKEKLVATSLKHIINMYTTEKRFVLPDEIKKLLIKTMTEDFSMKILDASTKAKEKLEHFITRLYETLIKLSIHHAILSGREAIDVSDIVYARRLFTPIWNNLIISIESLLIISPQERMRRHRIIRTSIDEYKTQIRLKKFVKDKVWVRRRTMVKNLQHLWDNCSINTADNNLYKLEKSCELTNKAFINKLQYDKDKYFERKSIKGVAYLKLIKDIG